MPFRDAHVVITGGSSGIGLATACLVARRGASVSLMARDIHRLRQAAERVRASGAAIKPMTAERVAETIVRGIERKRFAIYPNRSTALLAGFGPLAAPLLRRMVDRKVRAAQRPMSAS